MKFSVLPSNQFVVTPPYYMRNQRTRNGIILGQNLLHGSKIDRSSLHLNEYSTQLWALPPIVTNSVAMMPILRGGADSVLNLAQESYHIQTLATYSTGKK